MAHRSKAMDDFFANMPNPDAIFQSWWPWIFAFGSGSLYGVRQWLRGPKCTGGNKLHNKVVIVTGASSGIGKEIALNFANRGGKIIMACRDETQGKLAAEDVRKETENMDVYFSKLDLNSFKSIKDFVERFKKKEKRLDILVNNAGVMMCPEGKTEDGFDIQFQTNYLGPFYLTELLLDILKESAPSRIINTTAAAHNLGDIDLEDINFENRDYNAGESYSQSKLAVVAHTFHLAERLKDSKVTCNVISPGICNTNIYRYLPLKQKKFIRISFAPFMWFLMKTAEDGAQLSVYCGTTSEMAEVTGKHFKDCKEEKVNEKANDKLLQEQLYQASLKWTKSAAAAIEGGDDSQTNSSDKKDEDNEKKVTRRKEKVVQSVMERVSLS
ncbi:retinol dehydrogenase 13 [Plakobranchus ocellatus]|uniref:Retinol dehydrogenase 13 n=1 Tax=Plakobranchus ocellatus TaxID=259542 RepID=A0AAV4AYR1_9GAST|nr:retinol dehydrogenase 13 [Plakobranchus ocellatus]